MAKYNARTYKTPYIQRALFKTVVVMFLGLIAWNYVLKQETTPSQLAIAGAVTFVGAAVVEKK